MDLDVVSTQPQNIYVRAAVDGRTVLQTAYLLSSTTVRHFKFRASRVLDFGKTPTWTLTASGPVTYSGIARFSKKDYLEETVAV